MEPTSLSSGMGRRKGSSEGTDGRGICSTGIDPCGPKASLLTPPTFLFRDASSWLGAPFLSEDDFFFHDLKTGTQRHFYSSWEPQSPSQGHRGIGCLGQVQPSGSFPRYLLRVS